MNTAQPDLYSNVHKGIRHALFTACTALGRATGDASREGAARALLTDALRFVGHHGENEDVLLLPLLRERAPAIFAAMNEEHSSLDALREALLRVESTEDLYRASCAFTARYLAHLDEEEQVLEAKIRAVVSTDEMLAFARESVQRTAPADQKMMLGWMVPALPRDAANALLARVPASVADELRSAVG